MDERLGETELLGRLKSALSDGGVGHADIYVRRMRRGFARYSLNTLNQHAESLEESATVRVGIPAEGGYRLAAMSVTDLAPDALIAALRRTESVAKAAPVVERWPGFAALSGETPKPPRFSEATAACSADHRANLLAPALAQARNQGLTAAGVLETSVYEVAVANTAGLARHADGTTSSFKMFALDADGNSGFDQSTHRDVGKLEVQRHAEEACAKSLAQRDPMVLPAGEYDVLLEPPAVVELLEWMSFIAFGARELEDGTSPLAGRLGETITGANVTIVDDALDESDVGFGIPFDRDGVVRQRVPLIERGVARNAVYDRYYGARSGRGSTGHAGPPGGEDSPVAQAVRMDAGDATLQQLTRGVKRGLHISRLHYVNGFLDPRRALMTGLTRDGTFLIENGERTRGVRNMRFTDSVLEAFARIDGMTAVRAAVPTWWSEAGAFVAPTLRIRGFRFTGGGVARPNM